MAGAFTLINNGKMAEHREYNVVMDIPPPRSLWKSTHHQSCGGPASEIDLVLNTRTRVCLNDYRYVKHHPLAEAYVLYMPPPHDRPTWDLTSVLCALRPSDSYFDISAKGHVQVADDGLTSHAATDEGRDRADTDPS